MSDGEVVCSCGSKMFFRSMRAGGWWVQLIDGTGNVVDTDLDNVRLGKAPKTVKCAECGKTNPNPKGET